MLSSLKKRWDNEEIKEIKNFAIKAAESSYNESKRTGINIPDSSTRVNKEGVAPKVIIKEEKVELKDRWKIQFSQPQCK